MAKNLLSAFNPFEINLPYAETHYKFNLPWSPLFKRWPEVFLDGPRFCVPGVAPRFYLIVKDAHLFPIKVCRVKITLQYQGNTECQLLEMQRSCQSEMEFLPLPITFPSAPGKVLINGLITVENAKGRCMDIFNSNLTGLHIPSLELELLENPLPYPPGWEAGELHCHSDYSNDQVEFGAPHIILQQVAQMLGLGFVISTDHSYEFQYDKIRYMKTTDPLEKWLQYRKAILSLNNSPTRPVMIPGEEVSCANCEGRNVHLLVMGCPRFIPGRGDGGRRWFNNRPDLTIGEVLELCKGYPAYAAHPKHIMGFLERKIFRRGVWRTEDIPDNTGNTVLHGLQFWNGYRGREYALGRAFWVRQLLRGSRLLSAGANDAHGDFNRYTGVRTPLFTLFHSLNHVFGIVRTVVRTKGHRVEDYLSGLVDGRQICTDGPFFTLHREGGRLDLQGESIPAFGAFEKIHLFTGTVGDDKEKAVMTFTPGCKAFSIEKNVEFPSGVSYCRAEAWTNKKRLAITSPIWEI